MIEERTQARVLVTGSVAWRDSVVIETVLADFAGKCEAGGASLLVITGMAEGADEIARTWAANNNIAILAEPLETGEYPEPMHRYNVKMMSWRPGIVAAFKERFDPEWASPTCIAGTEHMCRIGAEAGLPVLLNGTDLLAIP